MSFLSPEVEAVLLEAEAQVRQRFGLKAILRLSVDPDLRHPTAVLTVFVTGAIEEALRKLADLDEKWWFKAREGVKGNLEIDLAFV